MLKEMIDSVTTAEKKAAEAVLKAKEKAKNIQTDAELSGKQIKAQTEENIKNYKLSRMQDMEKLKEKTLCTARAEAQKEAAKAEQLSYKLQPKINEMMRDVLFS